MGAEHRTSKVARAHAALHERVAEQVKAETVQRRHDDALGKTTVEHGPMVEKQ